MDNGKTFIENLQSLDAPMKTRVLVVSSAVAMVVVVGLWVGYFNGIVVGSPVQLASQAQVNAAQNSVPTVLQTQPAQPSNAPGFWQMFGNSVSGFFKGLGGARQINIAPQK